VRPVVRQVSPDRTVQNEGQVVMAKAGHASQSVQHRVDVIDEIAKRVRENMLASIAYDAMLRRIHDHPDVIPTFNNRVAGHGFGLIQSGFIQLYMVSLTRCYDRSSENRASLPHAIDLLRDREVFEAITVRARAWLPELANENERTAQAKLSAAITDYDCLMSDCTFNTALTALRHHRDDYVAHSLLRMGDREPLLFGYLPDVLRMTLPIVAALDFVGRGVHWDPSDTIRVWEQHADEFWRRTLPC
jgi:hypothetical protein